MKKLLIITVILSICSLNYAQNTIQDARNMPLGDTVTVTGIVQNGAELGNIRYLMDSTAGISAYGSNLSTVQRGDSVTVTGVLSSYNQLLEIYPVDTFGSKDNLQKG